MSFSCILLLLALTGCSKEPDPPFFVPYDNSTPLSSLPEQDIHGCDLNAYSAPSRIRLAGSLSWWLDDLYSRGVATLVRYNKGRYYSVTCVSAPQTQPRQYLFLLYERNEYEEGVDRYYVADGFLVSKLPDKPFFETITPGMSRLDILENDPLAYTSSSSLGRLFHSYHRFEDKSILQITYEAGDLDYYVTESEFLENQLSVLDYLLPQDFDEID